MDDKQKTFIGWVTGKQVELAAFAEREVDRRLAFDGAMTALAGTKDTIREAMKVRLVDGNKSTGETALKNLEETDQDLKAKKGRKALGGKGQEHDLDTFKATRKGQGLTATDMQKVGEALRPIAAAAKAILEAKQRNGKPLFETQEEFEQALTDELFTPLVREGVLPENFVIDKFSEVQELLNATFKSYKDRNAGDRESAERKQAQDRNKRHGSGTGVEQFSATMSALASAPTALADKVGLDRDRRRRIGIAGAGGKALVSMVQMGMTLQSWQVDPVSGKPKIEANFEAQLNPGSQGFNQKDADDARTAMVQAKRAEKISRLGLSEAQAKHVTELLNLQEKKELASAKEGVSEGLGAVITTITGIVLPALKVKAIDEALAAVNAETRSIDAAMKAARAIDALLVSTLDTYIAGAGSAVAGMYVNALDTETVAEFSSDRNRDAKIIIREFALAFQDVLVDGIDPGLKAVGVSVAKAFVGAAEGAKLKTALADNPDTAYEPMVEAARKVLDVQLRVIDGEVKGKVNKSLMKALVTAVVNQVDDALAAAVGTATNKSAGAAFNGLYAGAVDVNAIVAAACADPVDGAAVIRHLASAFALAWKQAAPGASSAVFIKVGKAMQAALKPGDHAGALASAMGGDPAAAFRPVIQAAIAAIGVGLSGADGLADALALPDAQRELAARAAFPDGGAAALEELQASEKEMREYERQLVLVDEGGVTVAELRSIENLIEKLERDRIIAQMLLSTSGMLFGVGGSVVTIVGQQVEAVTDTLVGEIVGPLKAAKLVIKFSVAMKLANDRRILFQKFKKNLNLSKRAVSPMQSTLQGLLNNKVEQITFRTIEDAMTLVQIAAAVLGSIPEPITLAIGKTMGAIATAVDAGNTFSEMVYNEAMLTKGWKITLAAIRNPRDRVTGLAALKLNPTLGMHCIAWAGFERQPPEPVARALLNDLGLNEQTLMAAGSETKVRRYLETLLAEDRTLLDPELVTPKWIPAELRLTTASWAITVQRGVEMAKPALCKSTEPDILTVLKRIARRPTVDALDKAALRGALEPADIDPVLDDAALLVRLLLAYRPVASDGSEHDEMFNVGTNFLKLAREHEREANRIAVLNAGKQAIDVQRVVAAATRTVIELDVMITTDDAGELAAGFKKACDQISDIQFVDMHLDPGVVDAYQALFAKTQDVSQVLESKARAEEEKKKSPPQVVEKQDEVALS